MRGGGPGVQGAGWEEAPSRACGTAEWVPGWLPPVPPLALAPIRSMAGGTHCGSVVHSSPLSPARHIQVPLPACARSRLYSLMRARALMEAFLSPSQARQANWKLFSPWRKGPPCRKAGTLSLGL